MHDHYQIFDWPMQADAGMAYLQQRYETSLFLLGNLEAYGASSGESPNSGNFKAVTKDGITVGAYCLTKRGNLLVQGEDDANLVALIGADVDDEARQRQVVIAGVLGPWSIAAAIWDHFSSKGIIHSTSFRSKEILYRLSDLSVEVSAAHQVRLLTPDDHDQWRPLRLAYLEEEGLRQDMSEEDFRKGFLSLTQRRVIWGAFSEDQKLISMAGLNTKTREIGQIGGVYTFPTHRGQGIARTVMQHLIRDVQVIHKINKLILFTGEKNLPAQRLYEKLTFAKCGHFGLIFS